MRVSYPPLPVLNLDLTQNDFLFFVRILTHIPPFKIYIIRASPWQSSRSGRNPA